jgi:hypothetical protein
MQATLCGKGKKDTQLSGLDALRGSLNPRGPVSGKAGPREALARRVCVHVLQPLSHSRLIYCQRDGSVPPRDIKVGKLGTCLVTVAIGLSGTPG